MVLRTVGIGKVDVRGLVSPLDAIQHQWPQLNAGFQQSFA
jgi:hypothetical protein